MKFNRDYKNQAAAALSGCWLSAAVSSLALTLVGSATALIAIFVANPLDLGYDNSLRQNLTKGDNDFLPNSFKIAFSNDYFHKMCGMLLMDIYVILWTLLFIIPGFIMAFAYAMTPFILADEPELPVDQAITKSRRMMCGHKFDLFCLYLSFIGWFILCILTFGIGFFWLVPYAKTAKAAFYEDLKAEYQG